MESIGALDSDGRREVAITFELMPDALASVLSFGDLVEVIAPHDLRDAVPRALQSALMRYQESSHRDTDRTVGEDAGRELVRSGE